MLELRQHHGLRLSRPANELVTEGRHTPALRRLAADVNAARQPLGGGPGMAYRGGLRIPRWEVPMVLTVICMLVLIISFTAGAYFSGH